jgi:hypothetical protein
MHDDAEPHFSQGNSSRDCSPKATHGGRIMEEIINNLRAEIDWILRTLEECRRLNSLGKTLKLDEEINKILKAYNR